MREERYQLEEKLAVSELQQKSLQDLIATIKDGRGAAKVMEWHSKMDAVRIEELKHKRLNSKLQQQVNRLYGKGFDYRLYGKGFDYFFWTGDLNEYFLFDLKFYVFRRKECVKTNS